MLKTRMYQYTGPWSVISGTVLQMDGDPSAKSSHWYVYNETTDRKKKIGPAQMRGANYHDRATVEAEKRNKAYWKDNPPKLSKKEIAGLWIESDRIELEQWDKTTIRVKVRNFPTVIAQFEYKRGEGWREAGFFAGFDREIPDSFSRELETITIKVSGRGVYAPTFISDVNPDELLYVFSQWLDKELQDACMRGGNYVANTGGSFNIEITRSREKWQ